MNISRSVAIAVMVTGSLFLAGLSVEAAQKTATEPAPKVGGESSGKSPAKGSKDGRIIKKRRSSGKSIVEETAEGKSRPESQDSHESTPGTTLKFGSGGGGVAGATGR